MKKFCILLTLSLIIGMSNSIFAQSRYGADSAECIKYLSFYLEYMKQGNLKEAAPLWRKAIKLCPPQANQNMLLDGMKILRMELEANNNNPIRNKELKDSLMLLHQARITTYPRYMTTATINKAMDMMKYSNQGEEQEVIDALVSAMDIAKGKTPVSIPVRYMSYVNTLYSAGKKSSEEVINAFEKATSTAQLIQSTKPSDDINTALQDIENLFMQSGVANCDNLVALFTPRYEANPTDKTVLGGIVNMLSTSQCLDSDLFLKAVESLHKIESSHKSSYMLYQLYSQRNQVEEAGKYMEEAITLIGDTDNKQAADYYFELGTFYYKKGISSEAVKNAKLAAEKNPEIAGKAYFLVASVWGSMKCEGNEIEIRAPYWLAVDYMIKAKNADSTLAEEANKMIAQYCKYYPQQSEAFMFDILDGSTYTVACGGMRETTKVRTQK